ncbi:MAG TPA: hypothetical protein VLQ45_04810, partial [Thermoanaerobaculia bacterium]|nr:hypothetical protein [Thermoanaerobaculia bacterium]
GDDLRLAPRPRTAGGIVRTSDAAGRYLLRPLLPGALVRKSDLGTGHDLAGRWIVTLPIDPSALGPQVAAGADALLILSPKDPAVDPEVRKAVEAEALVLAIEKGTSAAPSGRVTLAIPLKERGDVIAALGSSQVFLARQGPTAAARTGRARRNAIGVPSRP